MTQNEDPLPSEVSRGVIDIGGIEVEVVHLDDGRRIITAESMERFMAFFDGVEPLPPPPESK